MPRTVSDLNDQVRYEANLTAQDLPDADLLRLYNKHYQDLITDIVNLDENFFFEISSADLIATQQEYTLPRKTLSDASTTEAMKTIKVELQLDGETFFTAKRMSITEFDNPVEVNDQTWVNDNFRTNEPAYFIAEQSLFLLPFPVLTVVGGIRLYYAERPNDLADSNDSPHQGFPLSYHYLLVEGALMDIGRRFRKTDLEASSTNKFNAGSAEMLNELEPRSLDEDLGFVANDDYQE